MKRKTTQINRFKKLTKGEKWRLTSLRYKQRLGKTVLADIKLFVEKSYHSLPMDWTRNLDSKALAERLVDLST